MDYTITWGGDTEDVWFKTHGVANVLDLHRMVREALESGRWRVGMRILLDHTDCDWSAMPLADVEQRASLLIRMAAEIGRQRCAFVVGDASSYGVARLLALLLDAQVDFRARAFTSIEEARTWLCETQAVGENHVVPAGS